MGWSLNVGAIAGTTIRLHITFLLFLTWIFFASYTSGGAEAAWNSLAFMLLLFACVVAHEFGHIFMARRFGVTTPTVTLLPIGGVAQLERIPEKPSEEFLVAIAGPAVNIVIAAALALSFGASLEPRNLAAVDDASIGIMDRLVVVNIFLVLFNMIPAFPMDGGRVLRAALASRLGYARATEIAASIGQFVAFCLGFLGLFGNPLLIFIAIFVYLAAASEAQLVAVRAMSRGVPIGAAMMTQFATLPPDAPIDQAIETLLRTSQNEFPVVDGRQTRRCTRPKRSDPRAQAARSGRTRCRRHDKSDSDRGQSRLPRRSLPYLAGEGRAGRRRGRCKRTACWFGHVRNDRRNVDGA